MVSNTTKKIIVALVVLGLFIAMSGIVDGRGSSGGGGRSSGGSHVGSGSKMTSSPKVSSSAFTGTKVTTPKVGSSAFTGTQKTLSVSKDPTGKSVITGTPKVTSYTKGNKKVTKDTPKTYISGRSYKHGGREYQHVYYGSGFDFTSLLLMGYIMSHDDDGKVIYVNNATGEFVSEEDFEDETPESPGMESIFAIGGLLAVAFLALKRED